MAMKRQLTEDEFGQQATGGSSMENRKTDHSGRYIDIDMKTLPTKEEPIGIT